MGNSNFDYDFFTTILMIMQVRRHQQLLHAAKFGYVGVVKKLILTKYMNVNTSDQVRRITFKAYV